MPGGEGAARSGGAALSCAYVGAALAVPWLGFAREPLGGRRNCGQAQGASAARRLAQGHTYQIHAIGNADDGLNLIVPL